MDARCLIQIYLIAKKGSNHLLILMSTAKTHKNNTDVTIVLFSLYLSSPLSGKERYFPDDDGVPAAPCHPVKIQQVLLNILSNGAQAIFGELSVSFSFFFLFSPEIWISACRSVCSFQPNSHSQA